MVTDKQKLEEVRRQKEEGSSLDSRLVAFVEGRITYNRDQVRDRSRELASLLELQQCTGSPTSEQEDKVRSQIQFLLEIADRFES